MTLQYSMQWDGLAHVGQLFDADGAAEIVFYNGYRAGEHILGPVDYRGEQAVERREHVGALGLGIDNLALISNNPAVEQVSARPYEREGPYPSPPQHAHYLFKFGVYLGEIWHLSDLADWLRAHDRSRFLQTAPPLRLS
jgi:hypothetical protein